MFREAGFGEVAIETVEAELHAPSASWLVERLRFAPGMDAWLSSLGGQEAAAITALGARLEQRYDGGPVRLKAVAAIGVGRR